MSTLNLASVAVHSLSVGENAGYALVLALLSIAESLDVIAQAQATDAQI